MSYIEGEEATIRALLEDWAAATRANRQDDILKHHAADLVIYDVLPPMQYESAAAYRNSWGDWQPQTEGEMIFNLEGLRINAGVDTAFAFGFIRCGGTLDDGRIFQDLVRATFCLLKINGSWVVQHQHVSKPHEQR